MTTPLGTPIPWQCGHANCRGDGSWWLSIFGVVLCAHCKPPHFEEHVLKRGGPGTAPMVRQGSTTTPEDWVASREMVVPEKKTKKKVV